MYRQSCHNQKLLKALISSGHFLKNSWFSNVHFLSCSNPLYRLFYVLRWSRAGWHKQSASAYVCQALRWSLPPHDGPHHRNTPDCTLIQTNIMLLNNLFSIFPWYFFLTYICACTLDCFLLFSEISHAVKLFKFFSCSIVAIFFNMKFFQLCLLQKRSTEEIREHTFKES